MRRRSCHGAVEQSAPRPLSRLPGVKFRALIPAQRHQQHEPQVVPVGVAELFRGLPQGLHLGSGIDALARRQDASADPAADEAARVDAQRATLDVPVQTTR